MKKELDPPIEREIGGKKVVYRHKTVSFWGTFVPKLRWTKVKFYWDIFVQLNV
jgi:hypothetical protein